VTQRLAIVSDIHGNLVALEAVIADIDAHSPDLIVHGGDLAVIGPRPAEVIDRIHDLGWPGVLGNTDEILFDPSGQAEQQRRAPQLRGWLETLFETLTPWAGERLGEKRVNLLHELPRTWRQDRILLVHAGVDDLWRAPMPDASDDELLRAYGDSDAGLVIYGHIHRPYVRKLEGLTVANSGSVGLPYDSDPRPSYLLIDDGVPEVHRVEYDLDRAARDAAQAGFPLAGWLAQVQRSGRFAAPEGGT
jgi:putative phosphoesterase